MRGNITEGLQVLVGLFERGDSSFEFMTTISERFVYMGGCSIRVITHSSPLT